MQRCERETLSRYSDRCKMYICYRGQCLQFDVTRCVCVCVCQCLYTSILLTNTIIIQLNGGLFCKMYSIWFHFIFHYKRSTECVSTCNACFCVRSHGVLVRSNSKKQQATNSIVLQCETENRLVAQQARYLFETYVLFDLNSFTVCLMCVCVQNVVLFFDLSNLTLCVRVCVWVFMYRYNDI